VFLIYRSADICIYVEKQGNNSPSRSHERRGMLFVLILCTLANTMSQIGMNRSTTLYGKITNRSGTCGNTTDSDIF